jgi:hypothetical protein
MDKQSRCKKINLKLKQLQYCFFIGLIFQTVCAQNALNNFLKPSDSLNQKKRNTVFISETLLAAGTLIGLNQLWYADYPRSSFHFINDNAEWLQMDKLGHTYSSYQLGRFGAEMLYWSGASKKQQLIYGAGLGFAFLGSVEILDGFSSQWGASLGDIASNAAGTAMYVSQELIWSEQRIVPKISFHTTQYASYNPSVLGSSLSEQILKDYNGQTYWLSANLYSFFKKETIPKWVNIAVGYGAEGMIRGNNEALATFSGENPERFRQFYLSLDVDLTKIETKSPFLRSIFSVLNTIKIPAPALEYSSHSGLKFHYLYF